MEKFDYASLDGYLLRTFLTVLEESSVSRAAERLDVTQSTVSYSLSRLRQIFGDPLMIRSGQGLMPTERALALKQPVLEVLRAMEALTHGRPFDPTAEPMQFSIAANDMQRDLVFPEMLRRCRDQGVNVNLEISPSGVPTVQHLRDARCDLMLTPLPPDATDLLRQKIFAGSMMCYFDAEQREAPQSIDEYLAAEHATVQFVLGGRSDEVLVAPDLPHKPKPKLMVSNFAGLMSFIPGSAMVTTQLDLMRLNSLSGLAMAPLPFASEPVAVYQVWHHRSTNDPAHRWLRAQIKSISDMVSSA